MGAGESRESDADSTRTSIESQSAGDASSLRSIEVEVPAPADEDSNKAVLVGTLPFPPSSTLPAPNPLRTIMSGEALPAESTRRTPNSTEPSPSLKSVAAAPPANAAASKLGAALKGGKLRRDLMAVMGRAAADPKIEVSVEHAELMPHDEQGRMLRSAARSAASRPARASSCTWRGCSTCAASSGWRPLLAPQPRVQLARQRDREGELAQRSHDWERHLDQRHVRIARRPP